VVNEYLNTREIDTAYKKISHIERQFDYELLKKFEKEVSNTTKLPGDRVILINSPGGSTDIGQRMVDLINYEKKKGIKIICVVEHYAHSMAFNFLSNCDVRLAVPRSFCVVHKMEWRGVDQEQSRHTAVFFRRAADYLDRADEPFRQRNAHTMGLSLKEYDYYAENETAWTADSLYVMGYLHGYAKLK
jgi:ATP-dependent protease ClpP protease subunit